MLTADNCRSTNYCIVHIIPDTFCVSMATNYWHITFLFQFIELMCFSPGVSVKPCCPYESLTKCTAVLKCFCYSVIRDNFITGTPA